MPRSAGYVDIQALERLAERLRPLKRRTYDLMRVSPGDRVLDVGCGPGLDTVELAALVGPEGGVVGVDLDEEMIAAVRWNRICAARPTRPTCAGMAIC